MKIYCKNKKCRYFRFLSNPIHFRFRKGYYIPFDDDLCYGECRREEILINLIDTEGRQTNYKLAVCSDMEKDINDV